MDNFQKKRVSFYRIIFEICELGLAPKKTFDHHIIALAQIYIHIMKNCAIWVHKIANRYFKSAVKALIVKMNKHSNQCFRLINKKHTFPMMEYGFTCDNKMNCTHSIQNRAFVEELISLMCGQNFQRSWLDIKPWPFQMHYFINNYAKTSSIHKKKWRQTNHVW